MVVEVDGIHHSWAQQVVGDALRQNAITLSDALTLRLTSCEQIVRAATS